MDNAPENRSKDMMAVLTEFGCDPQYCPPHKGDSNLAEVYIRLVTRVARAMLAQAGMGLKFWGCAVQHANWLRNRTPCGYNYRSMSPMQAETGVAPDMSRIIPFGAMGNVHLPHDSRERAREEKMASATRICLFVGYSLEHRNCYKCFVPDNNTVLFRTDVRFQTVAEPQRGPSDGVFRLFRESVERCVGNGSLSSAAGTSQAFEQLLWDRDATTTDQDAAVTGAFDVVEASR